MTLHEFSFLDMAEQEDLLNHNGVFLQTTRSGDFLVDLYRFQKFYVELFYYFNHDGKIIISRCSISRGKFKASNDNLN